MDQMLSKVPPPAPPTPAKPAGGGYDDGMTQAGMGRGSGNPNSPVNITIHAGNQSPAEMAGHIQRHIAESRNYRSHDMEPELT